MTRRALFSQFSALLLAFTTLKGKALGWGFVDVERHFALRSKGINLRVIFNREDVTDRCFEADDQIGSVGLYKHRNGRPYIEFKGNETEAAKEFLHGRVEFVQ